MSESRARGLSRVLVAVVVTALVGAAVVGPAQAAEPEVVLLSQGQPAVASSLEPGNNFPARNAFDGDPSTRWSSAFTDPQWIRVDLGRKTTVHRVEIDWEVSYSTGFSIQLSDDGEVWETHWFGEGDGAQDVFNILGEGRYVQMYSTQRCCTAGNSIWEMRVYGEPAPKPKADPVTPKPEPEPSVEASEPVVEPTPSNEPEPEPSRSGPPGSVLYYVVKATPDGNVEKLNDIAEKFLGDRDRYPEIAELTEGHRQPDGEFLTDPRKLTAGWVLKMPKDASGDELKFGPLPGYEPSPSPSSSPSASPSASPEPMAEVADTEPMISAATWRTIGAVGAAVLVFALLTGLTFWLLRRRKRTEPFDDSLLRTDTSAAWTVDRALRVLTAACERDGLEVPRMTGVFIEGSLMRLRLTNPASPAPEPWTVSEDGQSWSAPLAKLQSAAASEGSTQRFARLINLGMGETGRVLVDFSVARGVISLDGPTRVRHEVLRRWLGELTGNPWSNDPRVVMVGNGLPQPEQVEHLAGIEQIFPELEVGDGGVLVLSQAPSASQQDLLAARFTNPEFGWVVIVLGSAPSAKWRFTAGDDGWLRSGFLPDVRFDEQTAVRRGGE